MTDNAEREARAALAWYESGYDANTGEPTGKGPLAFPAPDPVERKAGRDLARAVRGLLVARPVITEEAVERAATAMMTETYGDGAWEHREPMEDDLYRRRARVALSAAFGESHPHPFHDPACVVHPDLIQDHTNGSD